MVIWREPVNRILAMCPACFSLGEKGIELTLCTVTVRNGQNKSVTIQVCTKGQHLLLPEIPLTTEQKQKIIAEMQNKILQN